MDRLILDIQDHLASLLGDQLRTIDENYGQLQMMISDDPASDTYPVISPAVLIDVHDVQWRGLAGCAQQGTAAITITLAIDCYDDTHTNQLPSDEQRQRIADRLALLHRLHWALQGFKPTQATPLIRTSSRLYHLPRLWKAYELSYTTQLLDTMD